MRFVRWLVGSLLVSCGGSPTADVKVPLRTFETASQQTAEAMVSLYQHGLELKAGLDSGDPLELDVFVGQFPKDLDQLDAALKGLQAAEESLQAQPGLGTHVAQALGSGTGFMASLRKMFDVSGKYREWNKSLSDARNDRDDATTDVANAVPGAQERVSAAKARMNAVGYAVIEDLGTSVSTTLVTAPLKPVTLGGLLLKTAAKKAYQKGLVAITSTPACETDLTSKSCVVGIEHTDDQGQVRAPVGTTSVVVSGGGFARVRVDKTSVSATPATIIRDLVPIEKATASALTKGDEVDNDGFPVDPVYDVWVMCVDRVDAYTVTNGTCVRFDGGDSTVWDTFTSEQENAWCKGKGQAEKAAMSMTEADCRKTCSLLAEAPCVGTCTHFVCKTP